MRIATVLHCVLALLPVGTTFAADKPARETCFVAVPFLQGGNFRGEAGKRRKSGRRRHDSAIFRGRHAPRFCNEARRWQGDNRSSAGCVIGDARVRLDSGSGEREVRTRPQRPYRALRQSASRVVHIRVSEWEQSYKHSSLSRSFDTHSQKRPCKAQSDTQSATGTPMMC